MVIDGTVAGEVVGGSGAVIDGTVSGEEFGTMTTTTRVAVLEEWRVSL